MTSAPAKACLPSRKAQRTNPIELTMRATDHTMAVVPVGGTVFDIEKIK